MLEKTFFNCRHEFWNHDMAVDAFALILSTLALGMLFARFKVLPDNAADVLNRLVLYLCLPAAILTYAPRLHPDTSLIGLMLTPWLLTFVVWGLLALLHRWLDFRRDEYAVLFICIMLGNTSFIGYPMIRALLGDEALPYAVIYDQFGTFVLLSTVGLYVLARYSGDHAPSTRQILLRILRFPPLWALLIGITVMPETPPHWIASGLKSLADAMLPLVMLAVGFSLRLRLPRDEIRSLTVGLTLKLLLIPALAWPLSWLFGLQGDMLRANVLESAMPPMITAAALAIAHNLAPRLAAALVGYGILLSLVLLPLWAWLLR